MSKKVKKVKKTGKKKEYREKKLLRRKLLILTGVVVFFILLSLPVIIKSKKSKKISSFQECIKAGYPQLKSQIPQCQTPEGKIFTQKVTGEDYYGSSTKGFCQTDNDCQISGCNKEICQSKKEEPLSSICIKPDKPTARELGFKCRCLQSKCQWKK